MNNFYRTFYTSLLVISILFIGHAQVAYVKLDAAGAGNGTSWNDAYTNLQAALDATATGDVWLAAGTYIPTNVALDTFNTFLVSTEISIYGGFAGTESTKEERILGENTTILSGDILGDDVDNDFASNKTDNVFHVLTFDAPNLGTIVLDGITVSGGNTRQANDNSDYSWRGGGIFSYNTVDINNCNFNNNFGRSGGAIYLSPEKFGGVGSTINQCIFEKNSTFSQSAGIYLNTIPDVTISNSTFQNNTTNRGTIYPFNCDNILIENCDFLNNQPTDPGNFGGGLFIWNSKGTVRDCTFENNTMGNGAAIHIDGREELSPSADDFIFDNCIFTSNIALGFGGGALRSSRASYTVKSCTFSSNQATNGGAIYSSGDGQEIMVTNSIIDENIADFGAGQACYGLNSNYTLYDNGYTGNIANTSGGALITGFGSNVRIDLCDFISNIANFGGAMFNQNDTTNVEIYNSSFKENSVSDGNGGAINISGPVTLTVDNCKFESNSAGFGGAINGTQGAVDVIEGYVHISNSIISLNTASTQGAGISLVDLDLEMTNTVVSTNFNTGTGAGGGLSLNTTANKSAIFIITNSTIADNFALIGGGLGAFTEEENSQCLITLRNNIFSNEGLNYEVEGGNPGTISLGGNISTDLTLASILTGPGDKNESGDIKFVDGANSDFQLQNDSPAINIGSSVGAPDTDILGNPRVGAPDAGAYENQDPLGVEVLQNSGQLSLMPNPAQSYTSISLKNSWTGQIQISILDLAGKVISRSVSQKSGQQFTHRLTTSQLQSGNYILTLQSKEEKMAIPFIKI